MRKQKRIKKYQWCMGFLGFLGLLGFQGLFQNPPGTVESSCFLFFGFFSFFSNYWEYKLQQEQEDERLIENRLKAQSISFGISMMIIWGGAILINPIFSNFLNINTQYALTLILIAFGLAIGAILSTYLAYRYDTKE